MQACEKLDRALLMENAGICIWVDGVQVAVFYLPKEDQPLHAIGNHDPLGGANVMSRGIIGDIDGELVVASPLYKQHFSLLTGKCLEDDSVAIPVYKAELDGDKVRVTVQSES